MRRRQKHLALVEVASDESLAMTRRAGPRLRLPVEPQQAGLQRQLQAVQAQVLQLLRVA